MSPLLGLGLRAMGRILPKRWVCVIDVKKKKKKKKVIIDCCPVITLRVQYGLQIQYTIDCCDNRLERRF